MQRRWLVMLIALVLAGLMGIAPVAAWHEGTLTVAVATFGSANAGSHTCMSGRKTLCSSRCTKIS